MKDLTTANKIMADIAIQYPSITPLTPADFSLFQRFFAKEPHTYGNSWTYITQGMFGVGPQKIGYKFYDGTNLSAVCVYPKIEQPLTNVFYWIRPMGPTILTAINKISHEILTKYQIATYVKKLFKEQHDQLIQKGFQQITNFPWHKLYPMEDDTFPEQILDIKNTLTVAETINNRKRTNRALRYYFRFSTDPSITSDIVSVHQSEAKTFLKDFFAYNDRHAKTPNISDPTDYYAMIFGLADHDTTQNKFIYYKNRPIGFYFLEKQNGGYASLYALLSLRQQANHIVDYMMFDIIEALNSQNFQYLNMGGSENANLDFFKKKYRPIRENPMFWVCLN